MKRKVKEKSKVESRNFYLHLQVFCPAGRAMLVNFRNQHLVALQDLATLQRNFAWPDRRQLS